MAEVVTLAAVMAVMEDPHILEMFTHLVVETVAAIVIMQQSIQDNLQMVAVQVVTIAILFQEQVIHNYLQQD